MFSRRNKQLTFILYDGITDPTFESQVLTPLLHCLQSSATLEITLISFEKKRPDNTTLTTRIPAHDRLHLVLCRRLPFFGKLSLRFAAYQLKKFLTLFPCDQIKTRGALAGWITIRALYDLAQKHPERLRATSDVQFPPVTVQSCGLCAEEYRAAKTTSFWSSFIYKILKQIEFEVYRNKRKTDAPSQITIEAISPALKNFLVEHFRADPTKIVITTQDIPQTVPANQVVQWRREARQELHIAPDAQVYCYSGAFKPSLCAQETVEAFAFEYTRNRNASMLILTQDVQPFTNTLEALKVPKNNYKIITAHDQKKTYYLSAGDYGFLLRSSNITNWVSRPMIMLEYQAVGLKIIHNNTIAWLVK